MASMPDHEPDEPGSFNTTYEPDGHTWKAMSFDQEYDANGRQLGPLGLRWRTTFGTNAVTILERTPRMLQLHPSAPPMACFLVPIDQFSGDARLRVAQMVYQQTGEVPRDDGVLPVTGGGAIMIWRAEDEQRFYDWELD